jgi:type VI secretion system secreted protein Hcp
MDAFLKIEGIEGESKDAKHENEIDLLSFSWGETQSGSFAYGGGGGAGKVTMNDFAFTMKMNKATPKLFLACATGEHIPQAMLTVRKAGKEQQEYLKVKFSDLLVSSYTPSGSAYGDEVPTEAITLNFGKVEVEYREQLATGELGGTIRAGYDLKRMEGE